MSQSALTVQDLNSGDYVPSKDFQAKPEQSCDLRLKELPEGGTKGSLLKVVSQVNELYYIYIYI